MLSGAEIPGRWLSKRERILAGVLPFVYVGRRIARPKPLNVCSFAAAKFEKGTRGPD
jgi:hypothetical protein